MTDRAGLRLYIETLASADPLELNRAEQFAFWANLYNALTIEVVLNAYPVASIRNIGPTPLPIGPWWSRAVRVAGVDLSLNAIEQTILRRGWREPLVHYALNCASTSCPNLPLTAWKGEGLTMRLQSAARAYVNHPRGVRFEGDALVVSSIYRWYSADFGGGDRGIISHLSQFAEAPLRAQLLRTQRVARAEYDWSLNAQVQRS